jgi:hypothetical protein
METAAKRLTWAKWTYAWDASAGAHVLMSRARDAAGRQQPLSREPNRLDA